MTLSVINDTHVGAIRSGGTTPASAFQLRTAALDSLRAVLDLCDGTDLFVNGDLFDTFSIPMWDLWRTIEMFDEWLKSNEAHHATVSRGNHDVSKNSTMFSSFDLFCKIVGAMHPQRFHAITVPQWLTSHSDAFVIPHLPNQDLFNEALKKVPKCKYLFLHCNFDNKFALEADHSLNLSPEQAEALPVDHIILGHEHQRKSALAGKIVVVGNQIPTSVADCLGNDAKYLLRIQRSKLEFLPVWEAAKDFARPDWRSLSDIPPTARFVRVEGEATSAESPQVVAAISRLRSQSQALVITNAVSIDGVVSDDEMRMSLSSLKSFDVYSELCKLLDTDEVTLITNLMKEHNVSAAAAE